MSKGKTVEEIEDAAVRTVLRMTKIGAAAVLRRAGLLPSGRATFSMLREFHDFPASVIATNVSVEPLQKLLTNPENCKIVKAMDMAKVENPGGKWVLVAHGLDCGYVILTANRGEPPHYPHLSWPHRPLYMASLKEWIKSLNWAPASGWSGDDDSRIGDE